MKIVEVQSNQAQTIDTNLAKWEGQGKSLNDSTRKLHSLAASHSNPFTNTCFCQAAHSLDASLRIYSLRSQIVSQAVRFPVPLSVYPSVRKSDQPPTSTQVSYVLYSLKNLDGVTELKRKVCLTECKAVSQFLNSCLSVGLPACLILKFVSDFYGTSPRQLYYPTIFVMISAQLCTFRFFSISRAGWLSLHQSSYLTACLKVCKFV